MLTLMLLALATAARAEEPASLRAKFAKQFITGVALGGTLPTDYSPAELKLITTQFEALTPENCMKMTELQPREGRFNFKQADALVDFATVHGQKVVGHCLVWAKDERTPAWIFKDGAAPASRELLLARMRTHIMAVAGRYRGKVVSWDVLNEALDDGTATLRASSWLAIAGEEFIAKAFEYAHEADPDAVLVYNDYNIEFPAKRAKLVAFLRGLLAKKVPIHAVGLQGHFEIDKVGYKDVEALIEAVTGLGLKVAVTELDIDAIPRGRWWADGGRHHDEMSKINPYAAGCPEDVLARQAEQYGKLFEIFARHRGAISRVTFWDLHDGRSWLNTFPWNRVNHPLLFDRDCRPKPAYRAVLAAGGAE